MAQEPKGKQFQEDQADHIEQQLAAEREKSQNLIQYGLKQDDEITHLQEQLAAMRDYFGPERWDAALAKIGEGK